MKYEFKVDGMTCQSCVRHVTEAVREVDRSAQVEVELQNGKVTVETAELAEKIANAIKEAGYTVIAKL